MPITPSRREFLRNAAAAAIAATTTPQILPTAVRGEEARESRSAKSPNERLNLGVVGVAARGAANLHGVASQNIVALCDIDSVRLGKAGEKFPKASRFEDFHKLLELKNLDGVVVSTPDHTHAVVAVAALKRGLDVYCEKPLAHDVYEVRQIRNWTKRQNAVTQMGTQIHAGNNYRRVVEIIQSGAIGPVKRVHVWMNGGVRPGVRVAKATPPSTVNYDLWIGPAPMRPFHVSHFHYNWRYWWDFGGGTLSDFGCHYMDLPFWALGLRYPTSVSATGEKTYEGDNGVPNNMRVEYQFPARGEQPPVHMTWSHGAWIPEGAEEYHKGSAVLFEGEKGRVLADYGSRQVFLDDGSEFIAPEPTIPNSIGHHREWIEACKSRGETTCNFDYSGALAESVQLGNVSYRANSPLEWDAENLQATNCPAAQPLIRREYRQGWTL